MFKDFDLDIFKNEESYINTLGYNISYKTLIGAKLLLIRFDKLDGIY